MPDVSEVEICEMSTASLDYEPRNRSPRLQTFTIIRFNNFDLIPDGPSDFLHLRAKGVAVGEIETSPLERLKIPSNWATPEEFFDLGTLTVQVTEGEPEVWEVEI